MSLQNFYMPRIVKIIAKESTVTDWLKYTISLFTLRKYSGDDIQIFYADKVTLPLPENNSIKKINLIIIPEQFFKTKNAEAKIEQLVKYTSEITIIIAPETEKRYLQQYEDFQSLF